MKNIKLVNLKDGGILLFKKKKMKCTGIVPGFVFGTNRDNYPDPTAHFAEHMLFQGTKNLNKEEFGRKQIEVLPSLNASTDVFCLRLLVFRSNKLLKEALLLSSDMLLNPLFPADVMENEKEVIKQESVKRLNDAKFMFSRAYCRTIRDHYNLSTQIVGTNEEIDKMDAKTISDFYKDIAIRQNFVCAVASGLPLFRIKRLINKFYIDRMPSNPNYPVDKSIPSQYNFEKPGNMNIEFFPIEKTTGAIAFKLENCDEKDELIGKLWAKMLSQFTTGDYEFKLREKGLVYSAQASMIFDKACHNFNFDFYCSPANVNKIIDHIAQLLHDRRENLYDSDFVQSIQKNVEYADDEASTVKQNIAPRLFYQYLNNGTRNFKHKDRKKCEKMFASITNEDIRDFIRKHFSKPENIYVTIQTNAQKSEFYSYEEIQNKLISSAEK